MILFIMQPMAETKLVLHVYIGSISQQSINICICYEMDKRAEKIPKLLHYCFIHIWAVHDHRMVQISVHPRDI